MTFFYILPSTGSGQRGDPIRPAIDVASSFVCYPYGGEFLVGSWSPISGYTALIEVQVEAWTSAAGDINYQDVQRWYCPF